MKVPTYALDNAFQRNRNINQLYLGANPWRCNCLFAPAFQVYIHLKIVILVCFYVIFVFQDFLIKYKSLIRDLSDIKCSYQQDDEYYLTPVSTLDVTIFSFLNNKYNLMLGSQVLSSCNKIFV